MFFKKLILGLVTILFSTNLSFCETNNRLGGCLDLIHKHYDQNLISTECNDELSKIKRITAGVFLSNLAIPEDVESDSYDFGLNAKIQEILKSGSSTQKEAAIHFISYMMFNYESEYGSDNVYFNLIWKLFSDEWRKEAFLNLCVQTFASHTDNEINICRAYYDLFCLYIFKDNRSITKETLNKIIEIGLTHEDFFIQACVQMLKLYELKYKDSWNKEDFDFFKKDILIKTQKMLFSKFVLKKPTYSDEYPLNSITDNIRNGLFREQDKQAIEAKIENFKNSSTLKAFINLCNAAIDNNVGIKNIVEILSKVTLESCNYDLNKDLLKLCTRLTKYLDFFDTSLRFMQEYNEMGGLFSYGDEYYHFCSKLICNNLERFCSLEKLKEFTFNDLQNYKMLGSFMIGVVYCEWIIYENSNDTLDRHAMIIRHLRKNSDGNAHENLWYELEKFYNYTNLINEVSFQINEKNKKILPKDLFLIAMLFSKVYLCQNAIYNFLDISFIFGALISSKYTSKNSIEFINSIRYEGPMSYEDIFTYDCNRTYQRINKAYLDSLEINTDDIIYKFDDTVLPTL